MDTQDTSSGGGWLSGLVTALAGAYSADREAARQAEITKLGVSNNTTQAAIEAQTSGQLISGIDNNTLLIGGGAAIVLGLVAFLALK